jgi:hypothetical protein
MRITVTTILITLSPYLVALLRRCHWNSEVTVLASVAIVTVVYGIGQWVDGVRLWPVSQPLLEGLLAAWGAQQLLYKLPLKGTQAIKRLEDWEPGDMEVFIEETPPSGEVGH